MRGWFAGGATLILYCGVALACRAEAAASAASDLEAAAVRFKPFVLQQVAQCQRATENMRDRIAARDLLGAQAAWLAARSGWESSEVITSEFFPDLDRKIDAWPDADRGFHAIEAKLFGAQLRGARSAETAQCKRVAGGRP